MLSFVLLFLCFPTFLPCLSHERCSEFVAGDCCLCIIFVRNCHLCRAECFHLFLSVVIFVFFVVCTWKVIGLNRISSNVYLTAKNCSFSFLCFRSLFCIFVGACVIFIVFFKSVQCTWNVTHVCGFCRVFIFLQHLSLCHCCRVACWIRVCLVLSPRTPLFFVIICTVFRRTKPDWFSCSII